MNFLVKILLTIAMIFFMIVFVVATLFCVLEFLLGDFEWDGLSYFIILSFLLINLILSLLSRYFLLKYRLKH